MILKYLTKIVKRFDIRLLICSIVLFSIGLLMIYSASNVTAIINDATPGRYFYKELLFLVSGLFICSIFILFGTKHYYKMFSIGIGIIATSMICLFIYGEAVNGAYNWIGYKGFGIQPSEFAKVFIIPILAVYYEKNKNYSDDLMKMILPLILSAVLAGFIILQNDYGTAFIFILLVGFIFLMSPASAKIKRNVVFVCMGIFIVFLLAILIGGNKIIDQDKIDRFNISKPCERFLTSGNQLCNSYIAINGGGLFGKGLGNSTQKYLYLPEAHTDFIFSIFVEELGFVGAIVLILLYMFLLLRIYFDGKNALRVSHKLICYGVCVYLLLHILINLGGVMGIIPLTGVPLVFMSYGGSICWCVLLSLAMVQRVNYETYVKKARK